MGDRSARGWLAGLGGWPVTGGRGRSGRARALHGGWRCTEGVYFDILHQSWHCSTILVSIRLTL